MRIAILTHVFPPAGHPNAKLPGYYAKILSEAGHEVIVYSNKITSKTTSFSDLPNISVILTKDPLRLLNKNIGKTSFIPKTIYNLASSISYPDTFFLWVRNTIKRVERDGPFDKIIAFVIPASMFAEAQKSLSIKKNWIFVYQESITPYLKMYPNKSPLKRFFTKHTQCTEKTALEHAGKVIFTSSANRQAYIDSHLVEEEKTQHIPYFYSTTDGICETKQTNTSDFEISYFGNFDENGFRNPIKFFESLSIFLQKHADARKLTKVSFYGKWRPMYNKYIEKYKLSDIINLQPALEYTDYLNTIQQKTILLLIVSPNHNLFMPSKVVDYFKAQRPVLTFAPKGSEMWNCVTAAGMGEWLVEYTDEHAGAVAIEKLWQSFDKKELEVDKNKLNYWSDTVQSKVLIKTISQLIQDKTNLNT